MKTQHGPTTHICSHDHEGVQIRGRDLVNDLIGKTTFTEMAFLGIQGRMPTASETRIVDAALVTLMDHGLTPSVIAARLVYGSSPENLQSGVSAGLLAVGTVFVGTIEGCAELIDRILASGDIEEAARRIAGEHRAARKPVPGFGHPTFKPDDPRAIRLLEIGDSEGLPGRHIQALRALSAAVDEAWGRHLTINATGAIAALLGEIGVSARIMRGYALISRTAGLVAHLGEEQEEPTMSYVWEVVEKKVPFTSAARAT